MANSKNLSLGGKNAKRFRDQLHGNSKKPYMLWNGNRNNGFR
jgi:hypothetical protein